MTVITGRKSAVDGVQRGLSFWVREWTDETGLVHTGSASAVDRCDANRDFVGSYHARGHTPYKMPGETFWFSGATRDGKGVEAESVMVQRVRIVWPVLGGGYIRNQTFFGGNSSLTRGNYTVEPDSVTVPPTARGRGISLDGTAQAHVAAMQLDLWRNNPVYKDTTTTGQKKRLAGNLYGEVRYRVFLSDFTTLPSLDDELQVDLYATSSTYWRIKWGKVFLVKPMWTMSGKKPTYVGTEVRLRLTATKSGVIGTIIKPDATVWWPF